MAKQTRKLPDPPTSAGVVWRYVAGGFVFGWHILYLRHLRMFLATCLLGFSGVGTLIFFALAKTLSSMICGVIFTVIAMALSVFVLVKHVSGSGHELREYVAVTSSEDEDEDEDDQHKDDVLQLHKLRASTTMRQRRPMPRADNLS